MNERERKAHGLAATLTGMTPPAEPDAERGILAALCYGVAVDAIRATIRPEMLTDSASRAAYAILEPLAADGQTIDSIRVEAAIRDAGDNYAVADVIASAFDQPAYAVGGSWYADRVRRAYARRAAIDLGIQMIERGHTDESLMQGDGLSEFLADARAGLDAIDTGTQDDAGHEARDLLDSWFQTVEARARAASTVTGIPTGYPDLDRLTSGWQASDLIILAARPAVGKTAFALNLALNAASTGKKVAIFSLEMSAAQLEGRLLSILSGVPLTRTRRPTLLDEADMASLYAAGARLQGLPIHIDDRAGATIQQIRAACRKIRPDLVIVDYLQLMHGSARSYYSREAEVGEVSRALKGMAKELGIPVLALAQLNRQLEARDDKRPQLSDLRESGSIEQDADLILFLHRPDVYIRRTDGLRRQDSPAELIIGKARSGPCGTVRLLCHTPCTAFSSVRLDWQPAPAA